MSKHEQEQDPEDTIKYVYIPDEDLYGTIINEGLYYSIIEYFDNGVGYRIEVDNEDYIVVDEFGIGYINEEDDYL
jgi:hypothetical protein